MKNIRRIMLFIAVTCFTLLLANEGNLTKNNSIVDLNYYLNIDSVDESISKSNKSAYLGIYTENMTLKTARENEYNENYGIIITGVLPDTPADQQGLKKHDILMKIDDKIIEDTDKFTDIIESYYAGDKINLQYFRRGEVFEMEFVFGEKKVNSSFSFNFGEQSQETSKRSVGYGGGTWMPIWVELDMDDVNYLVKGVGFSKIADNGILHTGFGGKFSIGKGLFLGGMGAAYDITKKTNAMVGDENVIRRMKYKSTFGGVTLDKRFGISKNLYGSFGMMLGGASQSVEISQTKGDFSWTGYYQQIENSLNNYTKFQKSYIIAQPKVELLYRLTGWLALRAEGAYIASYGWSNGWNTKLTGDTFESTGSPNTKFDTFTISAGPWFGF